jgi:peptidyl-prolyl cis-trans isomerase SurA
VKIIPDFFLLRSRKSGFNTAAYPWVWVLAFLTFIPSTACPQKATRSMADYIVAVVNNEVITAIEIQQRINQITENAKRSGEKTPSAPQLRQQVLDNLIEERSILSLGREAGLKVEEQDVQRAINLIATQNQISTSQLKDQIQQEGMNYSRFVENIANQILVERYREREVLRRIDVSDMEIDSYIQKIRSNKSTAADIKYNIAQILIAIPEGSSKTEITKRQARAQYVLKKALNQENFAQLVAQFNEDKTLPPSGEMGLKATAQIPDLFLIKIQSLQTGEVLPELVRSGAGLHVLKVVERRESAAIPIPQTLVRHILLRTIDPGQRQAAIQSLLQMRIQIIKGDRTFESFAREFSEDGSANKGGNLGWSSPGLFVPEFEQAINKLPIGGVSGPVISRFGVHLIQVVERRDQLIERKQLREQARNALRQAKYETTYQEWLKEIRARVYLELRDPPES